MKKLVILFGIALFLFAACNLTAEQEASLNSSLSKYIKARNECQVVGLVGFTHPDLVSDYKSLGDSIFQHKFDCDKNVEYFNEINNATLRSTAKVGESIHILYDFDETNPESSKATRRSFELVAISENDGKNWFFIPWRDYSDPKNCKKLKRLIVK